MVGLSYMAFLCRKLCENQSIIQSIFHILLRYYKCLHLVFENVLIPNPVVFGFGFNWLNPTHVSRFTESETVFQMFALDSVTCLAVSMVIDINAEIQITLVFQFYQAE